MRPTEFISSIYQKHIKPFACISALSAVYTALHIYSLVSMGYSPIHPSIIVTVLRGISLLLSIFFAYTLLFTLINRRLLSIIAGFIISAYLFVNVLYFRAFESYITISQFILVREALTVRTEAMGYINDLDIFIFLCLVLSLAFLFRLLPKSWPMDRKRILVLLSVFLVFLAGRVGGHTPRYAYASLFQTGSPSSIFHSIITKESRHLGMLKNGFLITHAYDLHLIKQIHYQGERVEGREEYTLAVTPAEDKESLPNIIIIQVESLDTKVIDKKVNGKEITPFFNRLSKEALYFDNIAAIHMYAGGTSDADFAVLTSIHPLTIAPSWYAKGIERIPSLPWILAYHGYDTAAFHGNIGSFWGRRNAFPRLGFDKFYSAKHYSDMPRTFYGQVPDHYFLDRSRQYIIDMQSPFFAYLITLSAHSPYNKLEQAFVFEDDLDKSITAEPLLQQNYLRMISYSDAAVGDFVEFLRENLDNYIIAIVGDHSPNFGFGSDSHLPPEIVPLFLISSETASTGRHLDHLGTHLDIAPTILGMTNIPASQRWLGKDLTRSDRDSVCILKPMLRIQKDNSSELDNTCLDEKSEIATRYLSF
jgi:phosphoglycerol transferase MdoB-like AlkP superfamily enzyme